MRTIIFILAATVGCFGCKTAEFGVTYPVSGLHVVAKFEARDPAPGAEKEPTPPQVRRQTSVARGHGRRAS